MDDANVISYLAGVTLRSLGLASIAWMAMALCRVKSPSVRHAVWTVVAAGMLLLAAVRATLPGVPVRVLPARPHAPALSLPQTPATAPRPSPAAPLPKPPRQVPWGNLLAAVYVAGLIAFGARLACAYRLTRRLIRSSTPVPRFATEAVYQSPCISVPLTVGWMRPKILLPEGWDAWRPEKLDAVLIHERTHVARADWAVAVLAGVNRCVFWFHPLSWWIERELTMLAEHACDDASISQVSSRVSYAEVLVEMAAMVRGSKGRVAWEAMAMAKAAEVRLRVERILDDSRPVFPGVTRARWLTVAVCSLPLIYAAALIRPARVRAQPAQPAAAPVTVEQQGQTAPQPSTGTPPKIGRPAPAAAQESGAELDAYQRRIAAAGEALMRLMQQKLMLENQLQNTNRNYFQAVTGGQTRLEALQNLEAAAQALQAERHLAAGRALDAEVRNLAQQIDEKVRQVQELTRMAELIRSQLIPRQEAEELSRAAAPATGPGLISRRDPEYTPEALQAQIQGTVELSVTIGTDGIARDIQVIRKLDDGLDRMAIECVKTWRFRPAARRGQPVTAFASVEVRFRLP